MKKILLILVLTLFAGGCALRPFISQPDHVDEPADAKSVDVPVPVFEPVKFAFTHRYNEDTSFPFLGAALIDVNNDGTPEVFVAGGADQGDGLFAFRDGGFTNVAAKAGLGAKKKAATYSALSLDLDKDGDVDLVVSRDDGVYMLFNNGGVFTSKKIPVKLEANTLPLQIAPADLNGDGYAELYISTFIAPSHFRTATYNDPSHGRKNILLMNNGDNTFRDITDASGIKVRQNTFLSAFTDLNGDGKQDLVVAENTGRVRIFRNMGGTRFTEVPAPTNYGFWMSLAVADIDGDGDSDLFFSNVGNSVPAFAIKGDLKDNQKQDLEWGLLRNDGDFKFTSITRKAGLRGMEFGWGATFADFNLDGRPDLSVAENYIKWYVHGYSKAPGRFLVQDTKGNFIPVGHLSGVRNFYFGQSPLTADFNRDGFPDLIYVNMDGPVRAFLNKGRRGAKRPHYLTIALPDTVQSLGAIVTVNMADGRRIRREFTAGLGFLTDQSHEFIIGLGEKSTTVKSLEVVWASGKRKTIQNVRIDSRIVVKP